MNITFKAIGLTFNAEVEHCPVIPGRYSGPPEDCYPDEGGETEVLTITCNGIDASFLRDSEIWEDIESAAAEAAEAASSSDDDDIDPPWGDGQ